jgi:hypothetical protein
MFGSPACVPGCLSVWLVAMFTTVGNSLSDRSAKESGAGRAQVGAVGTMINTSAVMAHLTSETTERRARMRGNL